MSQTDAQIRATKKYLTKFDDIKLRVPSGERQILKEHAQSQGESLSEFLRRAANETMIRDKNK